MTSISIADALFTKTQQRVLALLYGQPKRSFYTNEIVRRAQMGRGTVRRELERLVAAGLLVTSRSGNQLHYRANSNNPVYPELLGIVRKTFGVADQIRNVLEPLMHKIDLAFIYGSVARGDDTQASDIDLMLVGDEIAYGEVVEFFIPLEASLGRPVNPTIYNTSEFADKLKAENSFLTRVMEQPTIMIKGDKDDFGKPG